MGWTWLVEALRGPTQSSSAIAVCLYYLAGAVTGIAVSFLFRKAFRLSGVKFAVLPLATLAFACQFFGVWHWAWLSHFSPVPIEAGFLGYVLSTFLLMTFMSLLTPIFLALAWVNQWLMRFILTAKYQRVN
jgi:hypothetical protein